MILNPPCRLYLKPTPGGRDIQHEETGMERGGVRELARKVFKRAAPAETDEFDSRADAWFADSARARFGDAKRGVPLGFGLSAAVPTIVPLVLFVADHVLSAVTEITVEEGVKRGLTIFNSGGYRAWRGVHAI